MAIYESIFNMMEAIVPEFDRLGAFEDGTKKGDRATKNVVVGPAYANEGRDGRKPPPRVACDGMAQRRHPAEARWLAMGWHNDATPRRPMACDGVAEQRHPFGGCAI